MTAERSTALLPQRTQELFPPCLSAPWINPPNALKHAYVQQNTFEQKVYYSSRNQKVRFNAPR